jgi:purine nucleoside phosphorylase
MYLVHWLDMMYSSHINENQQIVRLTRHRVVHDVPPRDHTVIASCNQPELMAHVNCRRVLFYFAIGVLEDDLEDA